MNEHNPDGDIKEPGDTPQASGNHDASEPAAGAKAEETASAQERPVPQSSRSVVLQRLTPNSTWEDIVLDDVRREREFTADAAMAPPPSSERGFLPMAAVILVAALVGAGGGSLATAGLSRFMKTDDGATASASAAATAAVAEQSRQIESAISKLNGDIAALKTNSTTQSTKLAERMDRLEKAQAEPAAKLAKLSEAVEKLRAPAAAPETTSSIASAAATVPMPAAQPNRLPRVEGWVLRDVSDGVATVESRQGLFDVIPGDPLPGVGRVDAIRRQDGRWVVVTSRGLIVSR